VNGKVCGVVLGIVVVASNTVSAQNRQNRPAVRETYASASAMNDGALRIVTATGRTITIGPDARELGGRKHTATSAPVISADRTAVGAVARYGSEPDDIPLVLLVYAAGKLHRFRGDGRPIFEWHFDRGGAHIAVQQTTLHALAVRQFRPDFRSG
jgi:hypothetical protein